MLKTIAIDDEPLALQLLSGYIRKTPFLEHTGAFDNPFDAQHFLEKNQVDLIFLDIQMPDLSGLEFTRTLSDNQRIVFTTAHEKYALQGFKLDAVDYLLKPFEYDEFLNAAMKAKRLYNLEHGAPAEIEANAEYLFLKSDYKIRRINFNEILYIEGMKDYIKVFIQNEEKPILSLNSMKNLESKLPHTKFLRVHRSFIVNLDRVQTIDRSRIVFGKTYIAVGDQYKQSFQKFLDKNFL